MNPIIHDVRDPVCFIVNSSFPEQGYGDLNSATITRTHHVCKFSSCVHTQAVPTHY